jgi:Competence protein J (ComJ)
MEQGSKFKLGNKMAAASFPLIISYSQIAVFDGALKRPFNAWTERHVKQGFSWRTGSVSFATVEEAGRHAVEVDFATEHAHLPPQAIRIIQTPFVVPQNGSIEVASISDSVPLTLPSGNYALRFHYFPQNPGSIPRILFLFIKMENPSFKILRADAELSAGDDLLLSASQA